MKIIGDKNTFAVEYEVEMLEPVRMAYSRIWIQGQYFGDIEDTGHLFGIYNCLDRIIMKRETLAEPEFDDKTADEIMKLTFPYFLQNENLDIPGDGNLHRLRLYGHSFQFGENYDRFLVCIFAIDDIIHFVWQVYLSDNEYFPGYSRDVQHGIVNINDVKNVYEQLQKEFVSK